MRSLLAITVAKAILKVNRITGSGGSSLPGLVAQKFDPDILKKLVQNNFPRGIIVVTGTNGKTTTTSLIANILKVLNAWREKVIYSMENVPVIKEPIETYLHVNNVA
mgnify:CR=1 FL=1